MGGLPSWRRVNGQRGVVNRSFVVVVGAAVVARDLLLGAFRLLRDDES